MKNSLIEIYFITRANFRDSSNLVLITYTLQTTTRLLAASFLAPEDFRELQNSPKFIHNLFVTQLITSHHLF